MQACFFAWESDALNKREASLYFMNITCGLAYLGVNTYTFPFLRQMRAFAFPMKWKQNNGGKVDVDWIGLFVT